MKLHLQAGAEDGACGTVSTALTTEFEDVTCERCLETKEAKLAKVVTNEVDRRGISKRASEGRVRVLASFRRAAQVLVFLLP